MATRPPPASTPGPGQGRAGRRPSSPSSATRRTTRSPAAGATAAPRPPSRSAFTGRAAVLVLVLAVLAVSYASSARAWLKQRSEINALHAEISSSQKAVAELSQEKRRWHDPDYIETQARERLSWVMPGEVVYRVLADDGSVLSDGGSALSLPVSAPTSAEPPWWDTAWGSVVEAGKDAATVAAESRPQRRPAQHIGTAPSRSHRPTR